MIIIKNKQLEIYITQENKKPFVEWLESLDKEYRYRVKERLDRVALGNFGDWKSLDEGINELRLNFGSGYRIYFGQEKNSIILLLCGGNKASQKKDIKKARQYWKDFLAR